jgi:hypothetical protein
MRDMVDASDSREIMIFNNYIDDYNSRCSQFRFRRGSLDSVKAELPNQMMRIRAEARTRLR